MMVWLLAGGIIIAALTAVAGFYLIKLQRLKKAQALRLEQLTEEGERQRERVNTSIQILAGAVGSDELTLTEASIRICGLLDSLQASDEVREQYGAFYQLREATSHIPILDKWQALSRKEQFKLDKERQRLEQDHREFIVDAAQRIKGQRF